MLLGNLSLLRLLRLFHIIFFHAKREGELSIIFNNMLSSSTRFFTHAVAAGTAAAAGGSGGNSASSSTTSYSRCSRSRSSSSSPNAARRLLHRQRLRSGASCSSSSSSLSSTSSRERLGAIEEDDDLNVSSSSVTIDDKCYDYDASSSSATTRRAAVFGAAAAVAASATTVLAPSPPRAEAAVTSFVPKTATRAKTSLQNVVELTPENFKEYVSADAENPTPNVFVEFYAPWCPFCQKLEPIWNELPNELRKYGNETTIARMNVDKYTDYARAYGVSGFPTLMLFEAGKPVGAKTGLIDMQTALKYAGVSQAKLGLLAGPEKEKALDKVLTKDQVENARKELDIVRKEVSNGLAGESRDKALSALNVVDGVFVSQL